MEDVDLWYFGALTLKMRLVAASTPPKSKIAQIVRDLAWVVLFTILAVCQEDRNYSADLVLASLALFQIVEPRLEAAVGSRGKRGGARVIYYWAVRKDLILLLFAYPKNVSADLTPKQVAQLAKVVKEEFRDETENV